MVFAWNSRSKVPYHSFPARSLASYRYPTHLKTGRAVIGWCELGKQADEAARELTILSPQTVLVNARARSVLDMRAEWEKSVARKRKLRSRLIWIQEEIDFTVYSMYGLCDERLQYPSTEPADIEFDAGQRPFEILSGNNEDGFDVPDRVPQMWPEVIRSIWQSRIEAIQTNPHLKLIEDPHYKRRWIGRQGVFNHARDADEFGSACKRLVGRRIRVPHDVEHSRAKKLRKDCRGSPRGRAVSAGRGAIPRSSRF